MVKGLDTFKTHFKEFQDSFVLIGGAACDVWFSQQSLAFRATKDLDIVVIAEALDPVFVSAFRAFVDQGEYEIQQRAESSKPVLYRFSKPLQPDYPFMLEIFSRNLDHFDLNQDQAIVPIETESGHHSLSAILVDEDYYQLLREHRQLSNGIHFATATALIPLKAKAWLDLTARKKAGDNIDSKGIKKHRSDVFRLAATLPGESGPELTENILSDLQSFLHNFTPDAEEWPAILSSLKGTFGNDLKPADLTGALTTYFNIRNFES